MRFSTEKDKNEKDKKLFSEKYVENNGRDLTIPTHASAEKVVACCR
jgi:hypothetical protein